MADVPDARTLADAVRAEIAAVEEAIRSHPLLDQAEAGELGAERLRGFAREQHAVISSDKRSFSALAARFPAPPAGDLFLALAQGEAEALRRLGALAEAVGLPGEELRAGGRLHRAQAYPNHLARLALGGSRADAALAMLVNLDAWGANCGRLADALRRSPGLDERALGFFRFFAEPPPALADQLLAVVEEGLAAGDSPEAARAAARALQAYELMFWDSLAEDLSA